ncbi:MAG: methylmalonyl-CoA carboxyltransferase [Chloroflexi bacterium]|nr:methylmalonyl-CoA carboxyltransferase [Chloroflexota bacterium]
MASQAERYKELRDREQKEVAQGGPEAVRKQRQSGKLTARERLAILFDPGSFVETDLLVRHRSTNFDMGQTVVPAEGVVTGYGLVNCRRVCAFSQDFTSMGGTLGEMHARKICKIMDLAQKTGVPIVGINDSGGARIQEGVDALSGYGSIFFRNSCLSGVVPQISAIMGPTAGGAVYSPALTDFIFMVKKTGNMFITGPDVIKTATGEETDFESLGGAMVHNTRSGVAHFASDSDRDAIALIKDLLGYLPSNNMEDPPVVPLNPGTVQAIPGLDDVVPAGAKEDYDMKEVIRHIVDRGEFLEPQEWYARNIITCFGRLNGRTTGIVANQPRVLAGCLDVDAADKAARFIRFCDAFNIPLLSIVDVPGFLPGTEQEWKGIIRHGAKLLWSYSEATVPKITLITRKAYGGAYLAMCSRDLGADVVLAWPSAQIAVMGAEAAAKVIHRRDIQSASDPRAKLAEKVAEYEKLFYNPYVAASRGYVDAVIMPRDTRIRLIQALEMLKTKRETRPAKKHGNIPL